MAKLPEPLVIDHFATGLYTHRSQLFSPYRSVGVNVVSYHDAVLDGQDMELSTLLQWTRRPGFSKFCTQPFATNEFPLQFYSARTPSGTVLPFVDTNQNFSTFSPTDLTTLVVKSTAAQGFIQQVGGVTYYTNGIDLKKWNGTIVTNWGIKAPLVAPSITATGNGQFWQAGFTPPAHYIIVDYNGNFQRATTLGLTGAAVPLWSVAFGQQTIDNLAIWTNAGPYAGWVAATPYILGTVIVDSNGNLQEVTTAGTSGATNPGWATVIGNTTTDGGVTWTMRGIGFYVPTSPVGPIYPTSAATTGSGVAWDSPASIEAPSGGSASTFLLPATPNSQALQGKTFGFAVPGGATITGILAEIGIQGSTVAHGTLRLLKGGVVTGTSRSTGSFPSGQTTVSFGGSSDLWGTTLTPADVNSALFGLSLTTTAALTGKEFAIANVDFMRITVYYNSGTPGTLGTGQISAQAGYSYVACYHTTSGHVSTASAPTYTTGIILGQFANTLLVPASVEPSCDVVQFYRTADGGGVYYLLGSVPNPGTGNVSFVDNANPDANLIQTIIAPLNHLNDPPPSGMSVLCYWQGRIWGIVGNKVYFNAGPDCINGVPEESWPPANVFAYSGPSYGLSRTSQGLLVWGCDYVSMALGGPQTLSFYPYDLLQDFGISSPNAITQDGDTIAVLNTQHQCFTLDATGKSETGNYITEVLETFMPTASYVTYHRQGADSGLWLADGSINAVRYSLNVGSWGTIAKPVGGIGALRSIETSPGVKSLLMGRTTGGGYILTRDHTTRQDDGLNYTNCFVTIGSIVLTPLGQKLVPVEHIVLYCAAAGTGAAPTQPLIAILPNEISAALPASFIALSNPVSEYTTAANQTYSLQSLRWPTDSMNSALGSKLMHHIQIRITFPPENAVNILKSLAIMFEKDG